MNVFSFFFLFFCFFNILNSRLLRVIGVARWTVERPVDFSSFAFVKREKEETKNLIDF